MKKRLITLTTDFTLKNHYVGVMKGVIKSINPEAEIIDLCHDVPAYDIRAAALTLRDSHAFFPPGAIHIVVVDPGVGGERKAIAVQAAENFYIGPDNGVFTYVYKSDPSYQAFEITNGEYMLSTVSGTFHGRDIFAPAAAHLSLGVDVKSLGDPIQNVVRLQIVEPELSGGIVRGKVLYVDSFGNLITDIPEQLLDRNTIIKIGSYTINGVSGSYSEAREGEMLAIIGSSGYLEISVNKGRADDRIRSDNDKEIVLCVTVENNDKRAL